MKRTNSSSVESPPRQTRDAFSWTGECELGSAESGAKSLFAADKRGRRSKLRSPLHRDRIPLFFLLLSFFFFPPPRYTIFSVNFLPFVLIFHWSARIGQSRSSVVFVRSVGWWRSNDIYGSLEVGFFGVFSLSLFNNSIKKVIGKEEKEKLVKYWRKIFDDCM